MVGRPDGITVREAAWLVEGQRARVHNGNAPSAFVQYKNKIDAAISGGPIDVNILPDGSARYAWICCPENVDEAWVLLPTKKDRGLFPRIQIAHEDGATCSLMFTEQLADSLELAVISLCGMGGKDLYWSIRCGDFSPQENPRVKPTLAAGQIIDFRGGDRISTQNSRSFLEADGCGDELIDETESEDPFCGGREHHLISQSLGDPLRHIPMLPAFGSFLECNDVRLQPPQFLDGHLQPLFEMRPALEESRPSPIVQEIVGEYTQPRRGILAWFSCCRRSEESKYGGKPKEDMEEVAQHVSIPYADFIKLSSGQKRFPTLFEKQSQCLKGVLRPACCESIGIAHHERVSRRRHRTILAQTFERVLRSEHQDSLQPVRKDHAKHYVTCVA